ncbi:MAG: transglutaminase-like domain-containing protein, partial [Paramuribaculum sp.]|nr:transglutaminase-like domain-containing protein [Paramuribaculum sp.]
MKIKHILSIACISIVTSLSTSAQSLREKSMDMLYRYMPAADSANYSREFFSHNVDLALKARSEMPWGSKVPEREFLHFVVPVRVNNEDLDNHREVFYNELKDRVKNLSMKEAILEINHWCHEKVTYQPSDGRTHSPLASVSSAIGRCGEESTFGVAALRAMGIPARQVYTPRWAHTDDNHAWVEAWADGQWYFLGACEPEPVLNLGWFNAPASRGMLMHARVFGPYDGDEEILSTADGITDINVTDHYAPVDTLNVIVRDQEMNPIRDARVSFRIYNYAEFYPIATKLTGTDGSASVIAGRGDLLVWASDGKSLNFKKVRVGKDRRVEIILPRENNT